MSLYNAQIFSTLENLDLSAVHAFYDARRITELRQIAKGEGIKIAVLDSGCDLMHPDLVNRIQGAYDIKKLIDLAAVYMDRINILYLGGEPMLRSDDFYKEIALYCAEAYPNKKFRFSMQTNGTLLTKERAETLSLYDIEYDVSYDGLSTIAFRGNPEKIQAGIRSVQAVNRPVSIVCTANELFLADIFTEYNHFKSLGIRRAKLNYIYGNTATKDYTELYLSQMKALFDGWRYDPRAIDISTFTQYIEAMIGNVRGDMGLNCHEHWVGMDHDGDLGFCDFGAFPKSIKFGHINDCSDIADVFYHEERILYLKDIAKRFKNCWDAECPLAGKCRGGCNAQRYRETGSFRQVGTQYCYISQSLYNHIKDSIKSAQVEKLNPIITDILLKRDRNKAL